MAIQCAEVLGVPVKYHYIPIRTLAKILVVGVMVGCVSCVLCTVPKRFDRNRQGPTTAGPSFWSFQLLICLVAVLLSFGSMVGAKQRVAASAANKVGKSADAFDANGNRVSKLLERSTTR